MFSKTQLFIGGLTFVLVGIALGLVGPIIGNAFMAGSGATLFALGLGWLGLQRPTDV